MPVILVNPMNETKQAPASAAPRLAGLLGKTVALLDISKPRGDVLIAELETRLAARLPEVTIKRYKKPTFTKPAPDALRREIAQEADFVIEALAD